MIYAAVVLHYRAEELTKQCVSALLALELGEGDSLAVAVVDNGSPDGSGARLQAFYEGETRVRVLLLPDNEGFARGNNAGFRYIREALDPDYILVLNNDVLLRQKDFLIRADVLLRDGVFGVLGPDIRNPESGRHQSPSHKDPPDEEETKALLARYEAANRHFFAYWLRRKAKDGMKRHAGNKTGSRTGGPEIFVDPKHPSPLLRAEDVVLHGACYVFARSFTEKMENAFHPGTFLYMEEDILALLCRRAGIRMLYDPSLWAEHLEDGATKTEYRTAYAREKLKFREKGRSLKVYAALLADSGME